MTVRPVRSGRSAGARPALPGRTGGPGAALRSAGIARAAVQVAAGSALVLLLAVIVPLPWAGDLGMHAATLQRLRHDLADPGNPLVDADTQSPYYSPWTVLLGGLARLTGLPVFVVLRLAALAGLALLVTGVWRYARALTVREAARGTGARAAHGAGQRAVFALALLSLLFLWGTTPFLWSGFPGLHSLALTVSYPSTLTLGLAFHLWARLTAALRRRAGWGTWAGLGTLWAVILLCHQFTGVVATVGALATVLSARPARLPRAVWPRLGAGLLLGVLVLWAWPYYDFFALMGAGAGLESVHRELYRDLPARFGLVLLGVAALAVRWRRDRWDPLALFFALGALVFAAGWLSGHYAWGRALPAVLIPAQLAAALETFGAARRTLRAGWAVVLTGALAVGAWAQAGAVGYVVPREALPPAVEARYREPWTGYHWMTPWVKYGDVVMAETEPARRIPAYGPYTVAPGYPDFFLPDEKRRAAATEQYFAPRTPARVRRGIERAYGVRWVVDTTGTLHDTGLRAVARGPEGQTLYAVR
ncbi:hypothetical protein [Streptomyces sp. NWU339]|uniref:hypothetical protein n=1 Tax=Streptomyces sp. NWU339 TaxID=2185284 RepID=UPI0026B238AD